MEIRNENFEDWSKWKNTLKKAVNFGEKVGLSDSTIANIGAKIGDFLKAGTDPENREQRLLSELWDVADEEEQKALANVIVKMVQKD